MSRTASQEPTYEADTPRIIYPVTRSACRVVDLLCLVWTWALWQGKTEGAVIMQVGWLGEGGGGRGRRGCFSRDNDGGGGGAGGGGDTFVMSTEKQHIHKQVHSNSPTQTAKTVSISLSHKHTAPPRSRCADVRVEPSRHGADNLVP